MGLGWYWRLDGSSHLLLSRQILKVCYSSKQKLYGLRLCLLSLVGLRPFVLEDCRKVSILGKLFFLLS